MIDKHLEEKFAPQIKAIVGMLFIGRSDEMDMEKATDLFVLNLHPIKIACRIRTESYY